MKKYFYKQIFNESKKEIIVSMSNVKDMSYEDGKNELQKEVKDIATITDTKSNILLFNITPAKASSTLKEIEEACKKNGTYIGKNRNGDLFCRKDKTKKLITYDETEQCIKEYW